MIKIFFIVVVSASLAFFLVRIVQAIYRHRKFMAECESHDNDSLPPINLDNIPERLRHLVPLAEKWAIVDDVKRSVMEEEVSLQDKRSFLHEVWPHMEEIENGLTKSKRNRPSHTKQLFLWPYLRRQLR